MIFSFILKSACFAFFIPSVLFRLFVLIFDLKIGLLFSLLLLFCFSWEKSLPSVLLILFSVNILVEIGFCFFPLSLLFKSDPSISLAPVNEFFNILISKIGPLYKLSPLWDYLSLKQWYFDCLRDRIGLAWIPKLLWVVFLEIGGTTISLLFSDLLLVSKWSVGLAYWVRWL